MASQMVAILIGIAVLVLMSSAYCMTQIPTKEPFTNPQYSVSNLEINLCPTFASEIQTAKGSTDCCQGDMVDGKCNGTTFCTKSPAYPGVPACVDKWREYFQKKSNDVCPTSMRNYYEDIRNPNSIKGCSAGPITKDGKAPAQATRPKCRVYEKETDNRTKADSCYIERQRLRIRCPVVKGQAPSPSANVTQATNTFNFFFCQYPFEPNMPDRCTDKNTIYAYMNRVNPSWRTQASTTGSINDQLCSNYINARNMARERANRLEAERQKREAAERERNRLQSRLARFQSMFRKNQQDSSRLQLQLDEANRRCRR